MFGNFATAQSDVIPDWFKNNVQWWNEDKLSDEDIINSIDNLLKRGIIKVDSTKIINDTTLPETRLFLPPNNDGASIPSYVKNTFTSWESGMLSDSDVANTIKFLVEANTVTPSPSLDKQPKQKAAIIDQLDDLIPNKYFQQKAVIHLENAGYDVDVYSTKDITIDFYKNLPSMNYKFIYIRTHSLEVAELDNSTFLFTGEKYNVDNYITEQLFGQVRQALPLNDQLPDEMIQNATMVANETYFTIGSKFVDEQMVGKFPQSVIIVGGCESIRHLDLAKSLISRGATTIVGWDRTINSMENDTVMLALLEKVLVNKIGFYDAVPSVMDEFGSDLEYSSILQQIQPAR